MASKKLIPDLNKGIDKIRTEFSLSVLAYNMERAIQIAGIKNLIAAIKAG